MLRSQELGLKVSAIRLGCVGGGAMRSKGRLSASPVALVGSGLSRAACKVRDADSARFCTKGSEGHMRAQPGVKQLKRSMQRGLKCGCQAAFRSIPIHPELKETLVA